MTDLYIFSGGNQDTKNELMSGEENIYDKKEETEEEQPIIGGLSVSKLLKRKSNELNDSKLYSFFDNLAVPIGLACFTHSIDEHRNLSFGGQGIFSEGDCKNFDQGSTEMNDGVIQNNLFDRLFNLSSIPLSKAKSRRTRKKIPQ
jgi:hypothetical protein